MIRRSVSFLVFFVTFPAILCAGNPFLLNFPVIPDPGTGSMGVLAVNNSGVSVVRDGIPGQIAYQMAGPDGPGLGRIYSKAGAQSYVLTDIGSQFTTSVAINQKVLSIIDCYDGQFGWNGSAYTAGTRGTAVLKAIVGGGLFLSALTLTQVPIPTLLTASPNLIRFQVPSYTDAGGQATALQLWRQGSDGNWQTLGQLGLSATAQVFQDTAVTAGASYWYGVSVVYGWPGGSGEGALPSAMGQFVSHARSVSGVMVASNVQPTPTMIPTLLPQVNHDTGQIGWAAGPNPSHDGHFRIQFHTDKPASWELKTFGLDGALDKVFSGSVQTNGWQLAAIDLPRQASGIYLMELRVTQEGETEKTFPIRKVAIIR